VIAVDTNLLVYAHRSDSPFYANAVACLRQLAEGISPWGIPWPCLSEFYAIATHPRIYLPPSTTEQALTQIDVWLESPTLVLLAEGPRHWPILRDVLRAGRIAGPLSHDARIAALCLAHGVREFWTADRDFSRFAGLTTRNPLIAG
jgi:toxin-antitoxin system PIN domain toxin